ncbi:Uncharacterised protein [Collinsella intestinalis]|nr:Uncharacterised protein [Collinsella intestinalis]
MPAGGYMMPSRSRSAEKRSRSSAKSMASGCVPMIFTPLSASARVRLTGV